LAPFGAQAVLFVDIFILLICSFLSLSDDVDSLFVSHGNESPNVSAFAFFDGTLFGGEAARLMNIEFSATAIWTFHRPPPLFVVR